MRMKGIAVQGWRLRHNTLRTPRKTGWDFESLSLESEAIPKWRATRGGTRGKFFYARGTQRSGSAGLSCGSPCRLGVTACKPRSNETREKTPAHNNYTTPRTSFRMTPIQKSFRGVTLHGLPVRIELQWPFHASDGGSDWHVLHGTAGLADGGQLHADVALNLSQSINEVLPLREGELAFWVAINTARKALDDKQLELLKSGKRQPVPVSSRCYSLRRKQFTFWHVAAEEIEEFVAAQDLLGGGMERKPVLIADPCDAMYLDAPMNRCRRNCGRRRRYWPQGLVELGGMTRGRRMR